MEEPALTRHLDLEMEDIWSDEEEQRLAGDEETGLTAQERKNNRRRRKAAEIQRQPENRDIRNLTRRPGL